MPIAMRAETRAQAQGFAAALVKAGYSATVHIAEGKTHGALNQELGTPDDPTTLAVQAFLRICEERGLSQNQ
jgi:acetyl esterase/lipase